MICPYCGQENPDDLDKCKFCGGSLLETTEQPTHEAQAPEAVVTDQPQLQTLEPLPSSTQSAPVAPRGIYGNKLWWLVGCFILIFLLLGCAGLGWGIYRLVNQVGVPIQAILTPASNHTPIPTSIKNDILFFDDFSDPSSGWDRVDESDYSTNYFNDAYRITVDSNLSDSWANPGNESYADVVIEVEATKYGGPDDNDFGIICRYQDVDHFYYAIISSDGYYGISKVTSDSSDVIGRDHLDYSEVINQGSATNQLRFECIGETLNLYANGQLLDQQTDGDYSSGNVGLIAGTYDTPGTDILFDNFRVLAP